MSQGFGVRIRFMAFRAPRCRIRFKFSGLEGLGLSEGHLL